MSAKLIAITPNAQELIAYCARVSSNNQDNPNINGLLRYCAKHAHWSVFEMANMVIEVNTTRAISAQILRHSSFNFQEFSQRYQSVEMDLEIPKLRRQDIKNRQNSISDLDLDLVKELQTNIEEHFRKTKNLYNILLDKGVAKECARMILPMSSPTKIYINGNIRSWIHYLQVRCDASTQLEHRLIADKIKEIFSVQLPVIYKAVFHPPLELGASQQFPPCGSQSCPS
jgi:thymidylate synthase (FAD)